MLPFRQIVGLFVKIFFLLASFACKQIKLFPQSPPLASIPAFNFYISVVWLMHMLQKNKKVIPYQYNITLKYTPRACIGQFKHVFSRYFFAFCVVEEISLVVRGDKVILGLIVNYVINCYYHVMINWVALIFCCCFSRYLKVCC